MTAAIEIEYDTIPSEYDFDLTVTAQLSRIYHILDKIKEEGHNSFSWGDSRIPTIFCSSYASAAAIRRALEMTDVEKHNCKYSIYYTGFTGGHKVIVSIYRSNVCEIVYTEEEVTEMVPDPDAALVELVSTKTVTTFNCGNLGEDEFDG